jgi:hypothetical protein
MKSLNWTYNSVQKLLRRAVVSQDINNMAAEQGTSTTTSSSHPKKLKGSLQRSASIRREVNSSDAGPIHYSHRPDCRD